jgi:hypothetical protein
MKDLKLRKTRRGFPTDAKGSVTTCDESSRQLCESSPPYSKLRWAEDERSDFEEYSEVVPLDLLQELQSPGLPGSKKLKSIIIQDVESEYGCFISRIMALYDVKHKGYL